MKDLGTMNGWYAPISYPNGWEGPPVRGEDKVPPEYTACVAAGHPHRETRLGRCWNRYTCDICQITWDVDSSD